MLPSLRDKENPVTRILVLPLVNHFPGQQARTCTGLTSNGLTLGHPLAVADQNHVHVFENSLPARSMFDSDLTGTYDVSNTGGRGGHQFHPSRKKSPPSMYRQSPYWGWRCQPNPATTSPLTGAAIVRGSRAAPVPWVMPPAWLRRLGSSGHRGPIQHQLPNQRRGVSTANLLWGMDPTTGGEGSASGTICSKRPRK